jgi:hypothetical protein
MVFPYLFCAEARLLTEKQRGQKRRERDKAANDSTAKKASHYRAAKRDTAPRSVYMNECVNTAFDLCTALVTAPTFQQTSLERHFYRWEKVTYERFDTGAGFYSDNTKNNVTFVEKKITMSLNTTFGSSLLGRRYNEIFDVCGAIKETAMDCHGRHGNWKPWVYIRPTTRCSSPDENGKQQYGLFSARSFAKGEYVGVYMGSIEKKEDTSYAVKLKVGSHLVDVDAGGGIDSGFPLHFGIHFINDPTDACDEGTETFLQKSKMGNIAVHSDGIAYTLKAVPIDTEFLMIYDRIFPPVPAQLP